MAVCSETRRATLVGLVRSISWGLEYCWPPLSGCPGVLLNCTQAEQVLEGPTSSGNRVS